MNEVLLEKYERLKAYIADLGSVAVAFSGGVDSTLLLKVAHDVLGANAIAITACLHSFPMKEIEESVGFCAAEGVSHSLVVVDELSLEGFAENPPNRCYICKKNLFQNILNKAKESGISCVIEGSNTDDTGDYRPGLRALEELKVVSPLKACDLSKVEIREISKELGLYTWIKPSMACLSTRIPYGETITREKLMMIDQGEQYLRTLGFAQVRVRLHDKMARIEILPEEFERFMEPNMRKQITDNLSRIGYSYITLDLKGYRTGSMNEMI